MAEEVGVSMVEDGDEELYEVEEDTSKEVVERSKAHIKIELSSQMSTVTLNIYSGPHSQKIQVKGSLRTRYAQSSCKIKRGAPPDLIVLKMTTING